MELIPDILAFITRHFLYYKIHKRYKGGNKIEAGT